MTTSADSAAVAAPEGSPTAPSTAAPSTDAGTGTGPTTAAAARDSLFGRSTPDATAADARAALDLPPRDASGQFTTTEKPAAESAPETAVAEAGPAASAEAAKPTETPAAATVPEGFIRIELRDGSHIRQTRGIDHVVVPAEMEDFTRWALNNEVRRDDVVRWQQYANQWKDRAAQAEARATAFETVGQELMLDPKTAHIISDIQKTYGPEAAEAYKRGLIKDKIEGKAQELLTQTQEQESQASAERIAADFTTEAFGVAQKVFPLFTQTEFEDALATYGALMERRGQDMPDMRQFLQHAQSLYLQKPNVRDALSKQQAETARQERERAAQAERDRIKKEEEARLAAAKARRGEIPLAGVPAAAATGATLGVVSGPKTASEARNGLFNRRVARA